MCTFDFALKVRATVCRFAGRMQMTDWEKQWDKQRKAGAGRKTAFWFPRTFLKQSVIKNMQILHLPTLFECPLWKEKKAMGYEQRAVLTNNSPAFWLHLILRCPKSNISVCTWSAYQTVCENNLYEKSKRERERLGWLLLFVNAEHPAGGGVSTADRCPVTQQRQRHRARRTILSISPAHLSMLSWDRSLLPSP